MGVGDRREMQRRPGKPDRERQRRTAAQQRPPFGDEQRRRAEDMLFGFQ